MVKAMSSANGLPTLTPGLGDDVAKEVLQWIGAFRRLKQATIISFNMQDYEFWGKGRLSSHLIRQLALGARIVVMTTPPRGKTGMGTEFKRKLSLLEDLDKYGADVYLHDRLHAKAYLFSESTDSKMLIVGSANLTSRGFGRPGTASDDLLELALLTEDSCSYSSTLQLIEDRLIGDPDTLDFSTWVGLNRSKVAQAKGAR